MKTIKKFFQQLAKQGLYKGQLFLEGTEYRFSQEKGFEEIEGQEAKIPTLKIKAPKKETIKREPVAADEYEIDLDKKVKEEAKAEPISIVSEKPPAEAKKKQIFTIVSFGIFFIAAVFIVVYGIKLLKKSSSPALNKINQTEAPVGESEQIQKEAGEKITGSTSEYWKYIGQAKDYMVAEDLDKAQESLVKAKILNDSEEIKKLENELETLKKLKAEAEKVKAKKKEKPEKIKTIRTVLIRDLSTRIIREYNRMLQKNIRINLPKKIKASGYITMNLFINEKGNISISSYNDAGLTIKPASKKGYVLELIKSGIWIIQFPPPQDKKNQLVKVRNWRLNFQVSQYKRIMILRKQ